MNITSDFADRLIELMQEGGLSNLELEKVSGCKNQSVSSWLTKGVYPKVNNLLNLGRYFDCNIDYLLALTDRKSSFSSSGNSSSQGDALNSNASHATSVNTETFLVHPSYDVIDKAATLLRINNLVNESRVTRYRISKECGFNASSFIAWEKRNLTPDTLTLIKLAKYFNCSVDYIIGISNNPNKY